MSMFKIKIKCLPSWDINAGPPLVIRLPSQAPRPYWLTIHILALFLWNFEGVSFWLVWHSLLWQDTKWKSFSRVRLCNPMECISSVQFSHSVISYSLKPHEPQHARPPCPSPTPRVHPNPRTLSRWCHPAISSSVIPFSSCPQSFPASGSFQMSQLFASGGQSIGISASTSVLPMNIQDWSPLG